MTVIKYYINYYDKKIYNLEGGCPKNTILKKEYTTKKGTYVKSKCIKDRGKPGKGPKILPLLDKKISLSKFGYKVNNTKIERQKSLVKAVDDYKKRKKLSKRDAAVKILKRVVLIRTYNKSNDKIQDIMTNDIKFIQNKYLS